MGGRGGNKPNVIYVNAKAGKTLDANKFIDEGISKDFDADTLVRAAATRARDLGARYLTYDHPSAVYQDREQKVVVSLHPQEDLKFEKRYMVDKGGK